MTTPMLRSVCAYVNRRAATGAITQVTAASQRYILITFATFHGNRAPTSIGGADIERWLTSIAHLAPGTRRARYAVVHRYFDDLVTHGGIRRNPMAIVRTPTVPRAPHRALTADQCAAILAAAPDSFARCYLLLGLQCGFRRSEMVGIELGDIDWSAKSGPEVEVTGKGAHRRIVPMPTEASNAVRSYLAVRRGSGGPLLRMRHAPSQAVTGAYLARDFSLIAYAAGVKITPGDGVSLHALRHTAATDIYRASGDVIVVRDILGHASLATTHRYVAGMDRCGMSAAMAGRTYLAGLPEAV